MDKPVVWGTERLLPKPAISERMRNALFNALFVVLTVGILALCAGLGFGIIALVCLGLAQVFGIMVWWPVGFIAAIVAAVVAVVVAFSLMVGRGLGVLAG